MPSRFSYWHKKIKLGEAFIGWPKKDEYHPWRP